MGVHERRQRDFRRRESELLDTALAMLDTDQWLTVTIDQIAEAAEIGKGTVYKHFTSKDELHARLALAFHQRVLEAVRARAPSDDAERDLRGAFEIIGHAYHEPSPYRRIVQYCSRADFRRLLPEPLRRAFAAAEGELLDILEGMIQRGQADGRWSLLPPREHVFAALAVLTGAAGLATLGHPRDLDRDALCDVAVESAMAVLHRRTTRVAAGIGA